MPGLADQVEDLLASANRIECHTARRPGRLAVVAVSRELSGSAARRVAESAGWQVVEVVTLDDGRSLADRLTILQAVEADAWLLAGGFDEGHSARALEAAALAAAARRPGSGPVVWAGADALGADVTAMFEPDAVTVVANPRPAARREEPGPLRDHLQELLRDVVAHEGETHLTAIAIPRAVGALAASTGLRILAVDVGARSATSALAEPDGTVTSRVHGGGGLGGLVLVAGAAARVSRLAGDAGDDAAVADLLQTLRARPASLPHTPEELAGDAGGRPPAARVPARGRRARIDRSPHRSRFDDRLRAAPGAGGPDAARRRATARRHAARVDPAALLGPLGSLPDEEIVEGVALLGEDLLVPLGTAVVSRGGQPGRVAMRVTVHRPGWPPIAPIDLRTGQLQVVPLGRGQEAEVTIELSDGVSLGPARRSPRLQAMATGGAVGLILDARGAPIALPKRGDDRRAVLAAWRDALGREAPAGAERVA